MPGVVSARGAPNLIRSPPGSGRPFDLHARNAEISIARRFDLIDRKAREIRARLVEHRRRDRANPCQGGGRVERVESQVSDRAALASGVALSVVAFREVCADGELILRSAIEIYARVVLVAARAVGDGYRGQQYVGHVIQPAAAGVAQADILARRARERAYVEPARDHSAWPALRGEICAGGRKNARLCAALCPAW